MLERIPRQLEGSFGWCCRIVAEGLRGNNRQYEDIQALYNGNVVAWDLRECSVHIRCGGQGSGREILPVWKLWLGKEGGWVGVDSTGNNGWQLTLWGQLAFE